MHTLAFSSHDAFAIMAANEALAQHLWRIDAVLLLVCSWDVLCRRQAFGKRHMLGIGVVLFHPAWLLGARSGDGGMGMVQAAEAITAALAVWLLAQTIANVRNKKACVLAHPICPNLSNQAAASNSQATTTHIA